MTDGKHTHYSIRVEGALDQRWAAWFEGLTVTPGETETTISGPIRDSAALHGVLAEVRDLGLTLVEVRRIQAGHPSEGRGAR
jgi:hypothetical protein